MEVGEKKQARALRIREAVFAEGGVENSRLRLEALW